MQTTVIVNPTAGRGKAAAVWRELAAPATGAGYTVHFTSYPGHAKALATAAAVSGAGTVVSVGGDGTVHEIINGIAGRRVRLAVIPAGTGNDLARTLAIPLRPAAAWELLATGRTRTIDLGRVNGRYFMNVAGVGFDAEVVRDVNSRGRRLQGTAAYIFSVLKMLVSYRPAEISLRIGGEHFRRKIYIAAVANGQYYGGGMRVAPQAVPDDGLFSVCLVKELSKPAFLRAFPSVFAGRHTEHPAVEFMAAAAVRIESDPPLAVHADGEIIGVTPADFEIMPRVLNIVVP